MTNKLMMNEENLFPEKYGRDLERLNEKINTVEQIISDRSEAFEIYNRSNTEMIWKSHVLNQHGDFRRMQQISEQLSQKKRAMVSSKNDLRIKWCRLKIKEREYEEESDELRKNLIMAQVQKMKDEILLVEKPFKVCLKDVESLADLYDELKDNIEKRYGEFTEKMFEQEEKKYAVRRALKQCLRDISKDGRIGLGNQGYLEDIGLNPISIELVLCSYVNSQREMVNKCLQDKKPVPVSSDALEEFVEDCVNNFYPCMEKVYERRGLPVENKIDHLYLEEENDSGV